MLQVRRTSQLQFFKDFRYEASEFSDISFQVGDTVFYGGSRYEIKKRFFDFLEDGEGYVAYQAFEVIDGKQPKYYSEFDLDDGQTDSCRGGREVRGLSESREDFQIDIAGGKNYAGL
jgi:hypothetical protein